ncbi:hypothetical protein KKC94_03330, partial [Patescibacteria group bacterium]|nr:hypothetical protein [Patescibacteria group bacterium]
MPTVDSVLTLARSIALLSPAQLRRIETVVHFMSDEDLKQLEDMLLKLQEDEVKQLEKELEVRKQVES